MDKRELMKADDAAWERAQETMIATLTEQQREMWNAEFVRLSHQTFSLGFAYGARWGVKTAIEQMASVAGVR